MTVSPPQVDPALSRARRMRAPALMIGGLAVATAALHLRDPHDQGSWGMCPTAALGFACPGCGGLRAVNDLTHLDVAAAVSSNVMVVAALPIVVFVLGRWAVDSWSGRQRDHDARLAVTLTAVGVGLLAVFTVVRNLSFGAWFAP